jgi:hypothetical protein
MVSSYFYQRQTNRLREYPTFNDWILSRPKVTLQLEYICDNDGIPMVDFIGKVENLNNDWRYVTSILGIDVGLNRVKRSQHQHYSIYYTKEIKQIVEQMFERDIKYSKYRF